jgi:hypothetical protein
MASRTPGHRSTRTGLIAALIALVLVSAGCGGLDTELSPSEEDALAAYVERGGQPDALPPAPRKTLDTSGITTLDHAAWEGLTRRYVRDGLVDYDGFWASTDSREVMEGYLDLLASVDPAKLATDQERVAFWINAYNALVFRAAAEKRAGDPAFSPMDDDFAFFQIRQHLVAGEVLSLDGIEHGIIRGDESHPSVSTLEAADQEIIRALGAGVLSEPDGRIHVALNCAALSCPALPSRAFRAGDLDALLDERARLFVADPDRGAGPNGVSSLFMWFAADFDASHGSGRAFVEAYRDDVSDVAFDTFLPYDWTLNAQ